MKHILSILSLGFIAYVQAQVYKGNYCEYIVPTDLPAKGNNCNNDGYKFVVKGNNVGANKIRKQFLYVDGKVIIAFVENGKKFADCTSFTDVTGSVNCKLVTGLPGTSLTSTSGGGGSTSTTTEAPAGSNKSGGCGKSLSYTPGQTYDASILVSDPNLGEVTRTYKLHIPPNFPQDNSVAVPLVLDFHSWGDSAEGQLAASEFVDVSNLEDPGFIVVLPNGMADNPNPGSWGSFNVSRSDGPFGPPCDTNREKYGGTSCYSSCPNCNPVNSCDWSSCHDDVAFTRTLLTQMFDSLCVDLDSVHMTGFSNGALFSYYAVSRIDNVFASIAPNAATPMLGSGTLPSKGVNLIDFHGSRDSTVPYSADHESVLGAGPFETIISPDGFYFYEKQKYIRTWTEGFQCGSTGVQYPTPMDGVNGWGCTLWTGCTGGIEIVSCSGLHEHDYPFGNGGGGNYIDGTKILWNFMKTHRKK